MGSPSGSSPPVSAPTGPARCRPPLKWSPCRCRLSAPRTVGVVGRRLELLRLQQLDVHELDDDETEAGHHDDAEPPDVSPHQSATRFVDDPLTGSIVGGNGSGEGFMRRGSHGNRQAERLGRASPGGITATTSRASVCSLGGYASS